MLKTHDMRLKNLEIRDESYRSQQASTYDDRRYSLPSRTSLVSMKKSKSDWDTTGGEPIKEVLDDSMNNSNSVCVLSLSVKVEELQAKIL